MQGLKTGGRRKGTPNKHPTSFRERLRAYCDSIQVDPHQFMAQMLANPDTEPALQLQAAKELAQYMEPKLKALELTGTVAHTHTLTITDRTREANDRLARVRRGDLIALPAGQSVAD